MDVNHFFTNLFEDSLGLDVLGLESRFHELVKLVNRVTLRSFCHCIPCYYIMMLDLGDDKLRVPRHPGMYGAEYYLSDPTLEKLNLPILGIQDVTYHYPELCTDNHTMGVSMGMNSAIGYGGSISLDTILIGAEQTYTASILNNSLPYRIEWELRGGNIIYLKNFDHRGPVEIKIKTVYPNIASIPEDYYDAFLKLAKLDIKIKLWNELKYLGDVVTPVGNLDLKISDWESAEQNREEYIEELYQTTLFDRMGSDYFYIL